MVVEWLRSNEEALVSRVLNQCLNAATEVVAYMEKRRVKQREEQKEKEDFDINDVDKHQFESYRIRWARESKLGQHNSYKNLSTIEGKEIGEV